MIAEKKHYSLRDGAKRPLQAIAQGAVRSARSHNNKLHCAAFNCQLLVFNWVQYIKELRNRRCRRPLAGFPQGRVVSYKERKNFIELVGEGALCLRNSSETKFASDRNKEIV